MGAGVAAPRGCAGRRRACTDRLLGPPPQQPPQQHRTMKDSSSEMARQTPKPSMRCVLSSVVASCISCSSDCSCCASSSTRPSRLLARSSHSISLFAGGAGGRRKGDGRWGRLGPARWTAEGSDHASESSSSGQAGACGRRERRTQFAQRCACAPSDGLREVQGSWKWAEVASLSAGARQRRSQMLPPPPPPLPPAAPSCTAIWRPIGAAVTPALESTASVISPSIDSQAGIAQRLPASRAHSSPCPTARSPICSSQALPGTTSMS